MYWSQSENPYFLHMLVKIPSKATDIVKKRDVFFPVGPHNFPYSRAAVNEGMARGFS